MTWRTNLGGQFEAVDRKIRKIIIGQKIPLSKVELPQVLVPSSISTPPSPSTAISFPFPAPFLLIFGPVGVCVGDPENNILAGGVFCP
jgi:hypothetical protein